MKQFAKMVLMAAFVAVPAMSFAQEAVTKTNEELSTQYKYEIQALKAEIKANKQYQKSDPTNVELKTEAVAKKAALKELEAKKKAVDKAISADKKNVKAQQQSAKADSNAKRAEKDAEKAVKAAEKAIGNTNPDKKSYEELSAQYKLEIDALTAEIKANKARQKADPSNSVLKGEEKTKKAELATVRERKKAVDAAISAQKAAEKASKKADSKAAAANKAADKAADNARTADSMVGR